MLSKLKTFFTQSLSTFRTQQVLKLYNQGMYTQLAHKLPTYQTYKSIQIKNHPLAYYLIQQQNIECLQKLFANIQYKKQLLTETTPNKQSTKLYHLGFLKNNTKIDELLKESGFELGQVDEEKRSIVHYAAMENNVALILKGLESGCDVNGRDREGKTPLHHAAEGGKVEAIRVLLESGAEVDAIDEEDRYPLHYAILSSNLQSFLLLFPLSSHLPFNTLEKPFITACQQPNLKILSAILQSNPASIFHLGHNNFSPLHYAAIQNNADLASFLYQNKAMINCQDQYGYTPVHLAVVKDSVDVVKYLNEKGADLYIKAETGLNAIDSGMLMKGSKVEGYLKKIDMKEGKM